MRRSLLQRWRQYHEVSSLSTSFCFPFFPLHSIDTVLLARRVAMGFHLHVFWVWLLFGYGYDALTEFSMMSGSAGTGEGR